MLKAVIFDLDDTLIDWSGVTEDWDLIQTRRLTGVVDYIRQHHALESVDAYIDAFRSRARAAWEAARENLRAPSLADDLVRVAVELGVPPHVVNPQRCMEAYDWNVIPGSAAFPEAVDMLRHLRANGLRFGLITNAYQPMWARDIELRAHGLAEFFDECRFSAADFGYLKPHPSIFQAALDCLGTQPHEAVFVGDDLEADIAGARAAGLYAVLRVSRRRPPALNGHIQPDSIIHDLNELPSVLDRAFPGWSR